MVLSPAEVIMFFRRSVISLFLMLVHHAHAGSNNDSMTTTSSPICREVKSSVPWKYCFSPGVGTNAHKLILQFHGGGENEKSWFDPIGYAEPIRQAWKRKGLDAPSVVAVSFGQMWLLSKPSELPKSGLYDVFIDEVLPFIEKQLMKDQVSDRVVIGDSMGAFNAGVFALQNFKLVSKVALLCPALGTRVSEASKDRDSYVKETGAQKDYAQVVFDIRDDYFPSQEQENAISPINTIKTLVPEKNPPKFFLSCGDKDQFGFFYVADSFVKKAEAQGFNTVWRPVPNGEHCSFDVEGLANFLLQ